MQTLALLDLIPSVYKKPLCEMPGPSESCPIVMASLLPGTQLPSILTCIADILDDENFFITCRNQHPHSALSDVHTGISL